MNKKIACFIMSMLLSLSLVACSNNQDSEQGVKEIQEAEVNETEEETTKDIEVWKCPICGYSDCPSAEETGSGDQRKECLRYYECDLCGKGDLLDNMEIWTAETTGQQLATCKGKCTIELQEEYANDLASFHCSYCQDTGVLPGGTICDNCYCRRCGVPKEECTGQCSKCIGCGFDLDSCRCAYTCDICGLTGTCTEADCYTEHCNNCWEPVTVCSCYDLCRICGKPYIEHIGDCAEYDEGIYGNCDICGIALNEYGYCDNCR